MIKSSFKTSGNAELYAQHWPCDGDTEAKAVVLLVHGLGEHCARYQKLAEALTASGIAMCGFDLPGHGNSPGKAGFIESFSDYSDAVMRYRAQLEEWYPDKPVFLLGHSMGGLISSLLLVQGDANGDVQDQFAGCILSGPAIMSELQPGAVQTAVIEGLSKRLPKVGVLQLDANGVSRDAAVVQDYVNDPLVHHGKVSARLVKELFDSMHKVQRQAASIKLPILIMHGSADSMAAPAGSTFLHQHVSSKDKQLTIYEGLFHEIFNEPEAPEIHAKVAEWIVERLAG